MMKDILYLDSTTSTNKIAFEMAKQGSPNGFGVIAGTQTSGRGRLGKSWQSVPGKGLYCSIILRPRLSVTDYPKITMTTGLGVAKALESISGLQLSLKWPNDIYFNKRKCCGILSEASPVNQDEADRFAVVGIGININTDEFEFPKELHASATSLFLETGITYDLEQVFSKVRTEVLSHVEELERKGFQGILHRWKEKDMLFGKWLEWVSNSGEIVYGKSLGPDDSGQLVVCDEEGNYHEVISGDINLVKQK